MRPRPQSSRRRRSRCGSCLRPAASSPRQRLLRDQQRRARRLRARSTRHVEQVVEPRRAQVAHAVSATTKIAPVSSRSALLRVAERAQPFGARALEELQVVGVEDDAAGVGVFPVHAQRVAVRRTDSEGRGIGDRRRRDALCARELSVALRARSGASR